MLKAAYRVLSKILGTVKFPSGRNVLDTLFGVFKRKIDRICSWILFLLVGALFLGILYVSFRVELSHRLDPLTGGYLGLSMDPELFLNDNTGANTRSRIGQRN
jgi:hypothetical protein